VANTLNSTIIPILMDDIDALKQKIKALESQID